MKIMIASDIHGSAYYLRLLLQAFEQVKADRLLLLGDLLYHGPRNDLPKEYAPKEVFALLNSYKDRILAVRGNCDAEVDQMVLEFSMMAEYILLPIGEQIVYATHGHVWNEKNLPSLQKGDILLNGHTHIPKCTAHRDYIYMNPGSVSMPKEDTWHGYMLLDMDRVSFTWCDLMTGEVKLSY